MDAERRERWLVSPAYDAGWFVLPGILAALVGLMIGLLVPASDEDHLGLWIVGVVLVDVAHVWASLYRTYLDPVQRAAHWPALLWAPLVVAWVGFLLHLRDPLLFWGVLAYVAIFHFIKQHEGFVLLYLRAGEESERERWLARAALWSGTALPVVWWHAHLPRRFQWFIEGDLLTGLPTGVGSALIWLQVPVLLAFLFTRVQRAREGRSWLMVTALVLVPALNWNLGIVWFDDDRVFTITNVFLHGVPYLALVWITGGRAQVERGLDAAAGAGRSGPRRGAALIGVVLAYYGLLVLLAFSEEALWDRLVWHDHAGLFGAGIFEPGSVALAAIVALLTVPQATHYLLDRWIWKVGPRNPALAEQLGLGRAAQAPQDR